MKLKKLAVSMLSAGLVMSLGSEAVMGNEGESGIPGKTESTEAKVKFEGGILSLEKVSESIDFGEQKVSVSGENYSSLNSTFITVNDERGTGEGWTLSANVSNFMQEENNTLPGATIILKNGLISPEVDVTDEKNQSPTIHDEEGLELETGLGTDGIKEIVSAVGNTTDISNAQGVGRWMTEWQQDGSSEVELSVPSRSTSTGDHKATITWILTSGPNGFGG